MGRRSDVLRRGALAAACGLALLAAGCWREENTVVMSGRQAAERPAAATRVLGGPPGPAAAPAAPAPAAAAQASAAGAPAVAPVPTPTMPETVAKAEQRSGPAPAPGAGGGDGAALLAARPLVLPVEGVPASALNDMFDEGRPGHRHEAIDILAPQGTRVFAVDDGQVAKLFTSKPGGLTVYQFDPAGRLAYYYAHLDRYAEGLKEGMSVRRGDLIGYVGTSGNAGRTPHLHFAVFRLGPERRWWEGDAVNPYPALRQARPAG